MSTKAILSVFLFIASSTIYAQPFHTGNKQPVMIWHENFDSARWASSVDAQTNLLINPLLIPPGWIAGDNTGNSFYWHWSQQAPRGRYTSYDGINLLTSLQPSADPADMIQSSTAHDGFMMLESDFFNTAPDGNAVNQPVAMNSYIISPPIDLSAYPKVLLRYSHIFKMCCTSWSRDVSISTNFDTLNPGNATWIVIPDNLASVASSTENPVKVFTDISSIAGGASSVRIRWKVTGATHYYWLIDDVEIIAPYDFDLHINKIWADYLYHPTTAEPANYDQYWHGGYTAIPVDMAGNFVQYRAIVQNTGFQSVNNTSLHIQITRNETTAATFTSSPEPQTASLQYDTLMVENNYTPNEKGNYRIKFSVAAAQADGDTCDNAMYIDFKVTDSVYSRTGNDSQLFGRIGPASFPGGRVEGAEMAVLYEIPGIPSKRYRISSVMLFLHEHNDSAHVAGGNVFITARLYGTDETGNINESPSASTSEYEVQQTDLGQWISIPFIEDGSNFISPGSYYVVTEINTSTPNGQYHKDFYFAQDCTVPFPVMKTNLIRIGGFWETTPTNFAINLVIVPGPVQKISTDTANSMAIYFNGSSQTLELFQIEQNATIMIFHISGIKMEQAKAQVNHLSIPCQDWPAGLYIVKICTTQGKCFHFKFLK